MPIRVRVGVVIVQEDRLLLVNHRRMGRSYWVLPGGALQAGESLPACAAREVREETGLEIEVDRFLYLAEAYARDGVQHALNVVFLGRLAGGTHEPRAMAGWVIERPAFIPLKDLPGLTLLPPIAGEILADAAQGFSGPARHLENRWVALDAGDPRGTPEGEGRSRPRLGDRGYAG